MIVWVPASKVMDKLRIEQYVIFDLAGFFHFGLLLPVRLSAPVCQRQLWVEAAHVRLSRITAQKRNGEANHKVPELGHIHEETNQN